MELIQVSELEIQAIDAGRGIGDAFKWGTVGLGWGTSVGLPFGPIGSAIGGAVGALLGWIGGWFS